MFLLRANLLLLLMTCILYIAFVKCGEAPKGFQTPEMRSRRPRTRLTHKLFGRKKPPQGPQEVVRKHFYPIHAMRKNFINWYDVKKIEWHHIKRHEYRQYYNPNFKGKVRIIDRNAETDVFIGVKTMPEAVGIGSKAFCVEVLVKQRHTDLKEIPTRIVDKNEKDLSQHFKMIENRLWKCLDQVWTNTFFVVEREFVGLKAFRKATIFHNVKAWSVQLHQREKRNHRQTVRFTEKKYLEEDGNQIYYCPRHVHYETPNTKKWDFSGRVVADDEVRGETQK